jgi:ketosteroid isomerase-like protein
VTARDETPLPDRREDVETVKRVFDAFGRRDIEGSLRLFHPQVRLWVVTAAVMRDGHPYVGHAGIREYFSDVDRLWQALELRPSQFNRVDDAVVVLGDVRARGAAGELTQPTVWTWKFTQELVIDCRVDSDIQAARDALGASKAVADLLREYVAAFNRRDAEAMVVLAAPWIANYPAAVSQRGEKYVGHEGIRNWIRDVRTSGIGHTVSANEVRKLEPTRWAVLGELLVHDAPISPFASLIAVEDGLIAEVREYLSEESLLRELGHLP